MFGSAIPTVPAYISSALRRRIRWPWSWPGRSFISLITGRGCPFAPARTAEFTYQSQRLLSAAPVRFRAHYRGLGKLSSIDQGRPGSIEHFLTERYCLFTINRGGQLLRGDIHHMPWPLEAAEAEIELNELPATYGIELPATAPLLHYSRELVVYLWSLERMWGKLPVLEAAAARTAEIV